MADTIRHQGIVESINGTHLQVRIVQTSACASCSIKGHCTSADVDEKLIDVLTYDSSSYRIGDAVWVMGTLAMGMKAVLLAFVVPLIILVTVLFALMNVQQNELIAVFGSIPCLAVYYFILWLNKSRITKKFTFTVRPLN
ncbi:MAG: RseC/MucC family positive regulator of sigma(E) [Mediterranea massiliensis]|nr:RseC/MucC family positive regulator of sigma(E) [Mediterranea massiliensis]